MGKRSPIVHVEWRSKDVARLQAFYRAVFRWKFEDAMPGYSVADTGSKEVGAGFMQLDAGDSHEPGVVSFLAAEDLAETEAAIREAGGKVLASSQPVPGWGRFSIFTDPDGNQLALWQSESAVKKEEKRTAKTAKKTEAQRAEAARSADEPAGETKKAAHKDAKKARKKDEKRAAKAARKADASDAAQAEFDGKPAKATKKTAGER